MLETADYSPESVSATARDCECKPVALDSDQSEEARYSGVDQAGRDSVLWEKEPKELRKRQ